MVRLIAPALLFILLEIVKGMLAYIGGQVLAAILGPSGPDLNTYFRNLVGAVRDIVKEALDEQQLQNCLADLESFRVLMTEYLNSPQNRFDTLKGLVDQSLFPVGRLQNLQSAYPAAAFAYLAGALFRLAVLQEYSKRLNSPADFKNFTDFAAYAAKNAREAEAKLPLINDARVTPVVSQSVASGMTHGAEPETIYVHTCSYLIDGVERHWSIRGTESQTEHGLPWPTADANHAHDVDLARIRSEFQTQVMDPLNHTLQQFDALAAMPFKPN
jgi:hypothetical protein